MTDFLSRRLLASCLLLGALAACAELPAGSARTSSGISLPSLAISQSDMLLQSIDAVRKLANAEQLRELDKSRQAYAHNASEFNRLRLAWLLALPGTSFHDTSAALSLLNDLPRDSKTGSTGLRALAGLLQAELSEQQRIAAANEDWTQKYKDELKRADALQQQIDGIKRMEKSMMQRDKR